MTDQHLANPSRSSEINCDAPHVPGNIVRLHMKNLMDYYDHVIEFGPGFTDSSCPSVSHIRSILVALHLVLGAPLVEDLVPAHLSRDPNLPAEVTAVVKNVNGEPNISLTWKAARRYDIHTIDGDRVPQTKVQELVQSLGNNHRGLLLQSRVEEFQALSPQQVLVSVLELVDDEVSTSSSQFQELVDPQNKLLKLALLKRQQGELWGDVSPQPDEVEKTKETVKKLEGVAVVIKGMILQETTDSIQRRVQELKEEYVQSRENLNVSDDYTLENETMVPGAGDFLNRYQELRQRHRQAQSEYEQFIWSMDGAHDEYTDFFNDLMESYEYPGDYGEKLSALLDEIEANAQQTRNKLVVLDEVEEAEKECNKGVVCIGSLLWIFQGQVRGVKRSLENLVDGISGRFQKLIKMKGGVSGQVKLVAESSSPSDWGIEILCEASDRNYCVSMFLQALKNGNDDQGIQQVIYLSLDKFETSDEDMGSW